MEDKERQAQILSLWLKRPPDKRTVDDVLMFYGELVKTHPELVKPGHGDPYQQLKIDLRGHVS
jgi:hypothetical protein